MKEYHLTEGNILKTLLRFAVPFLAAALLQSLYGAADLFVVGTYCSAESVAAVSTGTQVTQIITSLITGLTLGSTILIGQYTGSRETETVKRIIGTTFVVFGITAAVLTVVLLAFEQPCWCCCKRRRNRLCLPCVMLRSVFGVIFLSAVIMQ